MNGAAGKGGQLAGHGRITRKLASFLRLSRFEQLWFPLVWLLLALSKLAIFTVSFKRLSPYLGHNLGACAWVPLLPAGQIAQAHRIGRVVRLAARYTPWESNCFPQAIVARLLLGVYGLPYALYFGLMRDPDNPPGMKAHAWVASGRVPVVGGVSFGQYAVVGCFVSVDIL